MTSVVRPVTDGRVIRWDELPGPEVGARSGSVALLPVGATEQHGPHLPTGTDTIIATWLCGRASMATGAIVLPAVPVGCSYGHGREMPGTLSLTPELLADTVHTQILWAYQTTGIRRFLVINAHIGNAASLSVATDHLRLEHPELQVGVHDWARMTEPLWSDLVSDGDDWHANRGETAVMLAIAPDLVRTDLMVDADDEDRTRGLVFRYTARSLSRNGVTGKPSEATPELGRKLVDEAVEALVALVERARTEEPPLS
ncbi:MAG: crnA [Actinomycetia bacterium]|nr:crnA [Actinomycetes bacterium]